MNQRRRGDVTRSQTQTNQGERFFLQLPTLEPAESEYKRNRSKANLPHTRWFSSSFINSLRLLFSLSLRNSLPSSERRSSICGDETHADKVFSLFYLCLFNRKPLLLL